MGNPDFWKRKLLAFLHDPPNKPLDIAGHKDVAETCRRRAGISPEEAERFHSICDHTAAAADRFPFPKADCLKSEFSGMRDRKEPFRHPLGGSDLFFEEGGFPSANYAEERFQTCQPGGELLQLPENKRDWANFFLHWRRWAPSAAEIDWRTLFLPADTRIPDHNIWTHNSVVAAFQGCVDENGKLRPAFLLFHLSPVQEFIAQARSTRDLWSGSYLLSWLMANALKAVTDEIGPDSVIFPALRGQPLFDLLHRDTLYGKISFSSGDGKGEETLWQRLGLHKATAQILTPNLPNRFLAVVPSDQATRIAQKAEAAIYGELNRIGEACWQWLEEKLDAHQEWQTRFFAQIKQFPKVAWQVFPWGEGAVSEGIEIFRSLDPAPGENLAAVYNLAVEGIPTEDRDPRFFENGELKNQGFCWPAFYSQTDWLLAARRRFRDFQPWQTEEKPENSDKEKWKKSEFHFRRGVVKDSLSGVEEVIGSEDFWEKAPIKERFLFRSQDRLAAMNLIKKVWHKAYLSARWQLDGSQYLTFDSVPAVAAGKWRKKLLRALENSADLWTEFIPVREALISHQKTAANLELVVSVQGFGEEKWVQHTDPGCFSPAVWSQLRDKDKETAEEIVSRLRNFYGSEPAKQFGLDRPPVYYAVLAVDGDEMGKWVSGEKTPPILDQLSEGAKAYFTGRMTKRLELSRLQRPLSPSYHLQFSEALSNFALYLARPVVEYFGGQLIYAGGDDVLAMLPAETVLECARALRAAFRGEPRLATLLPGHFETFGEQGGFVRICPKLAGSSTPTWPLVVPGPRADCSVGVAIGHIHSPLQDLIRAAKAAEQRAKHRLGRAACAVSLYKRSGEILEWGFKWKSNAMEVFGEFQCLSGGQKPRLSSRFGYALETLLQLYRSPGKNGRKAAVDSANGFPIRKVVEQELAYVLNRQWQGDSKDSRKKGFFDLCCRYLDSLEADCAGAEQPAAARMTGGLNEVQQSLLTDLSRLFAVANFIARGEL